MTAMHCVEEASSLVVALGEHNIRTDIENHQAKVVLMIMIRCEDGVDIVDRLTQLFDIWIFICYIFHTNLKTQQGNLLVWIRRGM